MRMTRNEVVEQLERIGAGHFLMSGFAVGGDVHAEGVEAALRTTPDGAGTVGFEERLREVVAARKSSGREP